LEREIWRGPVFGKWQWSWKKFEIFFKAGMLNQIPKPQTRNLGGPAIPKGEIYGEQLSFIT
jgi:hypothetical protein